MSQWICRKCNYSRDGFKLLGRGFVRCPRCGVILFVTQEGLEISLYEDEMVQRFLRERGSNAEGKRR